MPHDTRTALSMLSEGNRRFVEGRSSGRHTADARAAVVEGQSPWAVIVGCSDSRVPAEAVFDAEVGELFVVRNAGNVVGDVGFASLRFAVEALGARTVVVLGHEGCGAVAAAVAGGAPDWLGPVAARVRTGGETDLTAAVEANARATAADLEARLRDAGLAVGVPAVVSAVYSLATGEVRWLDA